MNNCATCDHKKHADGGWCYMFRDQPAFKCMQHTALPKPSVAAAGLRQAIQMMRRG